MSTDNVQHTGPALNAEEEFSKARPWKRRTLGLCMLAAVVFLWTASNFLGSAVLADETYNKPFFLTYLNTAFFTIPLVPSLVLRSRQYPGELQQWLHDMKHWIRNWRLSNPLKRKPSTPLSHPNSPFATSSRQPSVSDSQELLLGPSHRPKSTPPPSHLTLTQTFLLALPFSPLWFLANYLIALSLRHTTVASSTILTSTSSIFTLVFGVLYRVETFTIRKLIGILASLAGVALVSSVDMSGKTSDQDHRGTFPEKTPQQLVLGNGLALGSAVAYGVYTVLMKKRIPNENAVSLPLLFSLIGTINIVTLWPFFVLLHYTSVETFVLPPNGTVSTIIILNGLASSVADLCWAQAVLLTSPIVVTVGLSLTIPLSLVGQMVVNAQTATVGYWVGAVVVVGAFVIVSREEGVGDVPSG